MRKTILTLVAASTLGLQAQTVDLMNDAIKDICFDYVAQAPANNNVSVYRDITYWNLFAMRQKGWNGGNGCTSMSLPDGNVLWMFGDSYFGRISENQERKSYNNRPHNAAQIQIQKGEWLAEDDFVDLNEYLNTNQNYPTNYYMAYPWVRHPKATLTADKLKLGYVDNDHYLRPDDATAILYSGQTHVQQLFGSYNSSDERDGTYLATFSVQGDPRENGYMMLLSIDPLPYVADFGHAILEDDGHNYLYGTVKSTTTSTGCWVVCARTKSRSLTSQWEYYIKDAEGNYNWQDQLPTSEEVYNSKVTGTLKACNPSVFKYEDKYYMVSQAGFGGPIQISQSSNPWGPFSAQKRLYTIKDDEKDVVDVHVHPQMSCMGELVISYSTDPEAITVYDKGDNDEILTTVVSGEQRNHYGWGSAQLNQPHFLRIFEWQKIFSESSREPIQDVLLSEWDLIDGISNVAINNNYKVYPQAVSTTFTIETENSDAYQWTLCSASGTKVLSGEAQGSTTVDASSLTNGIYIVSVGRGTDKITRKIIKQ